MQIVYIGPQGGLTDKKAEVSLHSQDTIISGSGTMTRVDMNEVQFKKWNVSKDEGTTSKVISELHELIRKKKS
jgi:hypothetical protein